MTYMTVYSEGIDEGVRADFERHLDAIRNSDPRVCPHRIGKASVEGGEMFWKHDPSDRSRIVSKAWAADGSIVQSAVAEARAAQPGWRALEPERRAQMVSALVPLIERGREELAAVVSAEAGKVCAEAIAEVDECVAIIERSVEQYLTSDAFAVPLAAPENALSAGVVYRPYGVFGVVGPFNFPLAIPVGMMVGALLTGNTVVFKPSAHAPRGGDVLFDLFRAAGIPDGVVNVVHGDGATGALLAESPIDGMAFTGSAEVGLQLVRNLTQPPHVRPVIAEMGGKNAAIISDTTTDIAVAAKAVARSAFGMSGQKCTACSRAIVFDGVYDAFVEALVAEVKTMVMGDPASSASLAGPVIDERSTQRFTSAVAAARADGRVLVGGGADTARGNYVDLTVVDQLPPGHALTRDELFLPLLTLIRVPDIDTAITEANAAEFGLSAGIFSDDQTERARFLDEIEAGIVFMNHPGGATTGVWPGSQTMSGWKASGTTGKGGFGPYYLQQFVREQSRTIFA